MYLRVPFFPTINGQVMNKSPSNVQLESREGKQWVLDIISPLRTISYARTGFSIKSPLSLSHCECVSLAVFSHQSCPCNLEWWNALMKTHSKLSSDWSKASQTPSTCINIGRERRKLWVLVRYTMWLCVCLVCPTSQQNEERPRRVRTIQRSEFVRVERQPQEEIWSRSTSNFISPYVFCFFYHQKASHPHCISYMNFSTVAVRTTLSQSLSHKHTHLLLMC